MLNFETVKSLYIEYITQLIDIFPDWPDSRLKERAKQKVWYHLVNVLFNNERNVKALMKKL